MAGPLEGLRVIELARVLAGPWAGQTLADLGADVVKIEGPGGDDTRSWGPPFVAAADGGHLSAAYFHACNRSKRSLVIDLASAQGQDAVRLLAGRADVLIENFKVGGLVRYGLDPARLRALNPRLITASITGFGQDGPYAARPGYDFIVQGLAGAMSITGPVEGPPLKTGFAMADIFSGLYATIAILAALRRREQTGEGAAIDIALMDCQAAVIANQALNYMVSGEVPGPMGNGHPNIVPYDVYPVADGQVIIAVGNDGQFARLCAVLGLAGLAADPAYATNPARVANRAALTQAISAATAALPRDALLEALEQAMVPAGPINRIDQLFADPQFIHRRMRLDLADPAAATGAIPGMRTPLVIDGKPVAGDRPSPRLGEHGDHRAAADIWSERG